MGDQIIARKMQTSTSGAYMPGNCQCGQCSAGTYVPDCNLTGGINDWTVWWNKCCSGFCRDQRTCVPPDRNECSIGTDSQGRDPLVDIAWDGSAPNLKCVYDLSFIDKLDQVRSYEKLFGKSDVVTGAYCGRPVPTCPAGLSTCSRYKSVGEGGDVCREWFATLKSDYLRDAVAENYCFRHNTDDCRCVNRSTTDEYKNLKRGNPINDRCWFVPCANPSRYFVPSDLMTGSCPENVCEIIFNIYKDRDVTIYDNDISCNFGPTPAGNTFIDFIKKYWAIPVLLILLSMLFAV